MGFGCASEERHHLKRLLILLTEEVILLWVGVLEESGVTVGLGLIFAHGEGEEAAKGFDWQMTIEGEAGAIKEVPGLHIGLAKLI
jgi:hypothetical protein